MEQETLWIQGSVAYSESDDLLSKKYRKNWARLIQKIYEVDPLSYPKFQGRMKIISFIEDEEVIEKIFKYLGPGR
jgi:hypothetical protein